MKKLGRFCLFLLVLPLVFAFSCGDSSIEPANGILSVSTNNLDFGVDRVRSSFTITNVGSGTLTWTLDETLSWATVIPTSGSTTTDIDTVIVIVIRPGVASDTLSGMISINSNAGSASIGIIAVDTVLAHPGIFSILNLNRILTPRGHMGLARKDFVSARFDSAYALCMPAAPIQVDSVMCNEFSCGWIDSLDTYEYDQVMPPSFLDPGLIYTFNVFGGSFAPSLVDSVIFPPSEPYLVLPVEEDSISRAADLDIEWANFGEGSVSISIVPTADSACVIPGIPGTVDGIYVESANDGIQTISASTLGGLSPGSYSLILNQYNIRFMDIDGYDPRSFIVGSTTSKITIYIE